MDRLRNQLTSSRLSRLRFAAVLLSLAPLAACERGRAEQPAQSGPVDSVVSRDEAIRRFRNGLPEPAGLSGGASSREALVRRFVAALSAADTTALAQMAVTRTEFAYLYYESSPQSLPPYDLSPALMWFTVEGKSRQDLATALGLLGGQPLRYVGHTCGAPRPEGRNRVYGFCAVRYLTGRGDTTTARLFGLILERQGHFKFLSYGNRL